MNFPLIAELLVGSFAAGGFSQKVGYYNPAMLAASVLMPVGAGRMSTTFQVETGHAMWIGHQVIFGFGLGLGLQQPSPGGAQTVLSRVDVPTGGSRSCSLRSSLGGRCL